VRINPLLSFRTLTDLLLKFSKKCKNLNSYENPFWDFNNSGKKTTRTRRVKKYQK
jgi:hypothetical protein